MATNQITKEFFNLHTDGVGYLNRVRWVEGKKSAGRRSERFLACSIAALRGDSENTSSTYFDIRVSGEEAIAIVSHLQPAVDAQQKVFLAFKLGDIYPHMYQRDVRDENRRPTGQKEMAALIKGRLLLVKSVTIDGERFYTRPEPEVAPNDQARGESHADKVQDRKVAEPQTSETPNAPVHSVSAERAALARVAIPTQPATVNRNRSSIPTSSPELEDLYDEIPF